MLNGKGVYKTQMTGPLVVLGVLLEMVELGSVGLEDSEAILELIAEWIPRRRDSWSSEILRLYPKTVGVAR